jgi:hypothetical protein
VRLAWAACAALLVPFAPADACSPVPGYRVPTTLDLVVGADAIVLASVTGARRTQEDSSVLLVPTLALKGTLPRTVALPGSHLEDDPRLRSPDGRAVVAPRSDPRELRTPNPDALSGGCVRRLFARGMQVALFLQRDRTGRLIPVRSTFARDAEDVSGPGALWVRAVREYVAIAATPRSQWPQRLRVRAAALRRAGGADALAIAADLEREARGR